MTPAAPAVQYPRAMEGFAVPGRLTVNLRELADGSLGYQVVESKKGGAVVRDFPVNWSREGNYMTVELDARAYAFAHNAEHHSRVGRLMTAFGNRDWDLKLHYVVGDDGSDKVRVACGKDVRDSVGPTKTIAEAHAAGLLDTWGDYRTCKKCWRNPALNLAIAREVHGA